MNNEPVAWMDYLEFTDVYDLNVSGRGIPLYTHPAKTLTDDPLINFKPIWQEKPELTLTDEEIIEVWDKMCSIVLDNDKNITDFARAILRKAQKK